MNLDKKKKIREIYDEIINLKESPLYEYRVKNEYKVVIGEGSLDASILFTGEAPGRKEAETGKPFCGQAGIVLDKLLLSIGLKREDIYITNIVNDRPPENRDPTISELKLYSPFLLRQIEIIKPKVIATLGRFSMKFILETFRMPEQKQSISNLHGKLLKTNAGFGPVTIIPLYHPAVALYNRNTFKELEKDFLLLKKFNPSYK